MKVEQFIYTKGRDGYSITAQSGGIGGDMTDQMWGYLFPSGIYPLDFTSSKSMVLLDGGLVAYSMIWNTGVGPDGRDGTFYNHTFVMDADEFQRSGADTRFLNVFCLHGIEEGMELQPFDANPPPRPPMPAGDSGLVLDAALDALISGKKVAIASPQTDVAQEILAALPPKLRMVPFSTHVVSASRQPRFRLVMNPGFAADPPPGFVLLDPQDPPETTGHTVHYADLVRRHDHRAVSEIHGTFDSIKEGGDHERFQLACALSEARASPGKMTPAEIIKMAALLGRSTRSQFEGLVRI